MTSNDPIVLTLVYLAAMVITVPIARKMGLGAVLGYLIAGAVLGPNLLGILGASQEKILHFSEFGVIMMLFLIGLELKPSVLWKLRGPIFGSGGLQVVLTTLSIMALGISLGGTWQAAMATGMIFSLSSTAIVLQTLQEKGGLKTTGGATAFSVLLFQDIAVIPMLAIFPLLVVDSDPSQLTETLKVGHPAWIQALKVLVAVGTVIISGKYLIRPIFRIIGMSKLRELFTAMALLLVVATTLLMNMVGLSPALGAFLAGVVLAESEYRHQLETDIAPFKGLLLGVFFISVGAGIDFVLLRDHPIFVGSAVLMILVFKWTVLFIVGKVGKLPLPDTLLLAFSLAQGGEFAFVLLKYAENEGIFDSPTSQSLTAAVVLSMFCAPLMIQSYFKWIQPRFAAGPKKREPDRIIENESPVIIAGFGRFGQMTTRLLRACGLRPTVLDFDAEQVDIVRRFGMKAFYGDASQMDLLRSAGAGHAQLLVIAIDDPEKALKIIDLVKKEFPNLKILARAFDRIQAYEMIHRGIMNPYIETSGSALNLGTEALRILGFPAKEALRASQLFKRRNDETIQELAKAYMELGDSDYLAHARKWTKALEKTLEGDIAGVTGEVDRSWESPPRVKITD
jgi:monovalent cation:proton antiporter-2 (CPA2) family protein